MPPVPAPGATTPMRRALMTAVGVSRKPIDASVLTAVPAMVELTAFSSVEAMVDARKTPNPLGNAEALESSDAAVTGIRRTRDRFSASPDGMGVTVAVTVIVVVVTKK